MVHAYGTRSNDPESMQHDTCRRTTIMFNDRSLAELKADFAVVARAAMRDGAPATTLTTLLHIGAEHAVVLSGQGENPEVVHRLDLGASRIARTFFHHAPRLHTRSSGRLIWSRMKSCNCVEWPRPMPR